MQHFKDSVTGQVYSFDDDVIVTDTNEVFSFKTRYEETLDVPETLKPYTLPPPPPSVPVPDVVGFISALKEAVGGIVGSNMLARSYPLFYPALQTGNWVDVVALIVDAHKSLVFSDVQYTAIKTLVETHNIPIVLP